MALFRRLSALGGLGALALALATVQLPLTASAVDGGPGTSTASRGDLPVAGVPDGRSSGTAARSGAGLPAADEQSFSCTSTGLGGSGQPSYTAETPGLLTGIAWSGTGTSGATGPDRTPSSPGSWPERLRRIRAYLTPLRDLQRLARAGVLDLLTTQVAVLVANLNQGNGIRLYLPP